MTLFLNVLVYVIMILEVENGQSFGKITLSFILRAESSQFLCYGYMSNTRLIVQSLLKKS